MKCEVLDIVRCLSILSLIFSLTSCAVHEQTPQAYGITTEKYMDLSCPVLAKSIAQTEEQKQLYTQNETEKRTSQWVIDAWRAAYTRKGCGTENFAATATPNSTVAAAQNQRKVMVGLGLQTVTASGAPELGLDRSSGALVVKVLQNMPAIKAGIRPWDVIIEIDGVPIKSAQEAVSTFANRGGKAFEVKVWREKAMKTHMVDLRGANSPNSTTIDVEKTASTKRGSSELTKRSKTPIFVYCGYIDTQLRKSWTSNIFSAQWSPTDDGADFFRSLEVEFYRHLARTERVTPRNKGICSFSESRSDIENQWNKSRNAFKYAFSGVDSYDVQWEPMR